MRINAVLISENDNVATLVKEASAEDEIDYIAGHVIALETIPAYHKVAVSDIASGTCVFKYGESIGIATKDIRAGECVHVHNLTDIVY